MPIDKTTVIELLEAIEEYHSENDCKAEGRIYCPTCLAIKKLGLNLPVKGERYLCKIEFWRYGILHHTEELELEYVGWNTVSDAPIFDIDTDGYAYPKIVSWKIDNTTYFTLKGE